MIVNVTNASGKFVAPGRSNYNGEKMVDPGTGVIEVKEVPGTTDPVGAEEPAIPPCPDYTPTTMEKIRHYFGSLWWLWIVVAILYFSNND